MTWRNVVYPAMVLVCACGSLAGARAQPAPPVASSAASRAAAFALFEIHLRGGRAAEARAILDRLDDALEADAPARADLADAYERLNLPHAAIAVWNKRSQAGDLPSEGRMRLAPLYERTQQPGKALEVWVSLWEDTAASAQRSLVADRILDLAVGQHQLERLIGELQERLDRGEATRNDVSLLIRLYTRATNKKRAIELTTRYSGSGNDVGALKEQARVYQALADPQAYDRTERRLIEADPPNRAAYLRNIILYRIERGGDGLGPDLKALLGELRAAEPGKTDEAFEAGILAMAGLRDEGIAAYRRAIAQAPSNGNNYLLLTALLKQQRRTDEAIALLTSVAGSPAVSDELFVIACDALLNLVATAPGDPADKPSGARLQWLERTVMERMVRAGDVPVFYRLLADVFEERKDVRAMLATVESSVALNPALRAATLRQLLNLTAPEEAGQRPQEETSMPDLQRHLSYGRRLAALGEQMPPEVYMALGRAFLEQQDPVAAERTFSLASDVTGQTNVPAQAAELFEDAGYDARAAEYYARVLIAGGGDAGMLVKYARLLERSGQRDHAHRLYDQAIGKVLAQPVATQAPDKQRTGSQGAPPAGRGWSPQSADPFGKLVEGYLRTWPRDPAGQARALDGMLARFGDELKGVPAGTALLPSSLERLTAFIRRVAFATGHLAYADRMDKQLCERFAGDAALVKSVVSIRTEWGLYKSAHAMAALSGHEPEPAHARADQLPSFDAALEEARRTGNFDAVRSMSAASANTGQILAVARAWAQTGAYQQVLDWAEGLLGQPDKLAFARYVLDCVRRDDKVLDALFENPFGDGLPLLTRLEKSAGEPVFAASKLLKELRFRVLAADGKIGSTPLGYIAARIDAREVPEVMRQLATVRRNADIAVDAIEVWRQVLRRPLPPDVGAQLLEVTKAALTGDTRVSAEIDRYRLAVASALMPPDLDAGNVDITRQLATFWHERTGESVEHAVPYLLLHEGHTDTAIKAYFDFLPGMLKELEQSGGYDSAIFQPLTAAFLKTCPDLFRQHLAEMEISGPTAATIELRHRLSWHGSTPQEQIAFWQRAAVAWPDNEEYPARLYVLYWQQSRAADALRMAERLHQLDPQNIVYRAVLFRALMESGDQQRAQALNAASPQDLSAPGFLRDLGEKAARMNLATQLLPLPEPDGPAPILATAAYRLPLALAQAMESGDETKIRNALRAYWQESASIGPDSALTWTAMLERPVMSAAEVAESYKQAAAKSQPDVPPRLFEVLASQSFAVEEFEDYLRAVDAPDREAVQRLYGDLAQAYRHRGEADAKRAALGQAILADTAGNHEFALWLELAAADAALRPAGLLEVLQHRLASQETLLRQQLRAVARIYAGYGLEAKAAEVQQLLAAQAPAAPDAARGGRAP